MSQAMTIDQLSELLKHIKDEHALGCGTRPIKYVNPCIDMRDGKCFSISLRGWFGDNKDFGTVNAERDIPTPLFERVMDWLDMKPERR